MSHYLEHRRVRILFATTAGVGHFAPLVPFAQASVRAGHEVLVAGHAEAAGQAARAGLPFRALPEPSRAAISRYRDGQSALPEMQAMARAVSELYVRLYAGTALQGMVAALEDWRPDVVVRESAEFASLVAVEHLGIPHVEVGIGLSIQMADQMMPLAAPALDDLGAALGLARGVADRATRAPSLTMAPRSLEASGAPERKNVSRFRERRGRDTGSLVLDWGEPDAPLVYVSFGTEVPSPTRDYFPRLYRSAVETLAELPVRVLVTIGDRRDPAELGPLPAAVRVEGWIPQRDVMPHAAVMVGHGGAGSTLGALAAGVPMALVPLFADQPLNAGRVAELGAGIALGRGADSAAELGGTVGELLGETRYRRRARRLADEIQSLPPVDEAAGLLAAIARDGDLAA